MIWLTLLHTGCSIVRHAVGEHILSKMKLMRPSGPTVLPCNCQPGARHSACCLRWLGVFVDVNKHQVSASSCFFSGRWHVAPFWMLHAGSASSAGAILLTRCVASTASRCAALLNPSSGAILSLLACPCGHRASRPGGSSSRPDMLQSMLSRSIFASSFCFMDLCSSQHSGVSRAC